MIQVHVDDAAEFVLPRSFDLDTQCRIIFKEAQLSGALRETAMVQAPAPRRFTVSEFHTMGTSGILSPDDRVELIDGDVRSMAPIGPDHGATVDVLSSWLHRQLGDSAIVRTQGSIQLNTYSEPLPDIAVLRMRADHNRHALPTGADIQLIIEVADSSLQFDRSTTVKAYASAGVPEVWVVDLVNQHVEASWDPAGDDYKLMRVAIIGEVLESATLSTLRIDVVSLF